MVAVGWPWWDGSLVCEEEEQGEREGAEEEEEHDNKEYNRDRQTGGEEGRRGGRCVGRLTDEEIDGELGRRRVLVLQRSPRGATRGPRTKTEEPIHESFLVVLEQLQ